MNKVTGSYQYFGEADGLPDEVEEGIGWADLLDLLLFSEFIL